MCFRYYLELTKEGLEVLLKFYRYTLWVGWGESKCYITKLLLIRIYFVHLYPKARIVCCFGAWAFKGYSWLPVLPTSFVLLKYFLSLLLKLNKNEIKTKLFKLKLIFIPNQSSQHGLPYSKSIHIHKVKHLKRKDIYARVLRGLLDHLEIRLRLNKK